MLGNFFHYTLNQQSYPRIVFILLLGQESSNSETDCFISWLHQQSFQNVEITLLFGSESSVSWNRRIFLSCFSRLGLKVVGRWPLSLLLPSNIWHPIDNKIFHSNGKSVIKLFSTFQGQSAMNAQETKKPSFLWNQKLAFYQLEG